MKEVSKIKYFVKADSIEKFETDVESLIEMVNDLYPNVSISIPPYNENQTEYTIIVSVDKER